MAIQAGESNRGQSIIYYTLHSFSFLPSDAQSDDPQCQKMSGIHETGVKNEQVVSLDTERELVTQVLASKQREVAIMGSVEVFNERVHTGIVKVLFQVVRNV